MTPSKQILYFVIVLAILLLIIISIQIFDISKIGFNDNFELIKHIGNEWSTGPILNLKTIQLHPSDINLTSSKFEEKYNKICAAILQKNYLSNFTEIDLKLNSTLTLNDYSIIPLDTFEIKQGCECNNKLYNYTCDEIKKKKGLLKDFKIYNQSQNEENIFEFFYEWFTNNPKGLNCKDVKSIKKPIYTWKNTIFCAERLNISYLDFVMTYKNDKCPIGYYPCGIVDNYKNILCMPNLADCPINSIKFLLQSKDNENNLQKIYDNPHLFLYTDYIQSSVKNNSVEIKRKIFSRIKDKNKGYTKENNKIALNFKIAEHLDCAESSDKYIKFTKADNNILYLKSNNFVNYFSNGNINNFSAFEYNKEKILLNNEYSFEKYKLNFENIEENCHINIKDKNSELSEINNNNFYRNYDFIDNYPFWKFYYQNGLIDDILNLPEYPRQNLYFNSSLFYFSYSGMDLSCRDLLLNMINFDTINFLEYVKTINHQNFEIWIIIILSGLFSSLIIELIFLAIEKKINENQNVERIFQNYNYIVWYGIYNILKIFFLILTSIYFRNLLSNMIFKPKNNTGDIDYGKLMNENKLSEKIISTCEDNINFQIFNILFSKFYNVNLFVACYIFIALLLILDPIIRFIREFYYKGDIYEKLNISDSISKDT